MIGQIVVAVRDALEPDPSTVTKYEGRRRPWKWEPNHLYVYPLSVRSEQYGTMPDCYRLDFTLQAVYVIDNDGEEANQERYAHIDDLLDEKAVAYRDNVLHAQSPVLAGTVLTGTTVNYDFFSDFDESGFALVITGYRLP